MSPSRREPDGTYFAASRSWAQPSPGHVPPLPAADADPVSQLALDVEALVRRAEDAPSARPAAAAVMRIADRPDSSAAELSNALAGEPTIAAHVMRVANSAFFGLSGKVTTLRFAVTVLGFSTVRGLAAAALLDATDGGGPPGVWRGAVAHAVAASRLSGPLGVQSQEAFCTGLLCGLGRFLLFQADPAGYVENVSIPAPHPADAATAERAWCGVDHAEVGARVFTAWTFPSILVDAVAAQHAPVEHFTATFTIAVRAAGELAARAVGFDARDDIAMLTRGLLREDDVTGIVGDVAGQADDMLAALGLSDAPAALPPPGAG